MFRDHERRGDHLLGDDARGNGTNDAGLGVGAEEAEVGNVIGEVDAFRNACRPASGEHARTLGSDLETREAEGTTLAEAAGFASSYVSQIETGKRDGTVDTLVKLAVALGVLVDDLIPATPGA